MTITEDAALTIGTAGPNTSSSTKSKVTPTEIKGTEYLVLELLHIPVPGQDEPGDVWREIHRGVHANAEAAIRDAIAGDDTAVGPFVAVPARSWRPVTPSIRPQPPVITFESA